jgi:hypothetical protein
MSKLKFLSVKNRVLANRMAASVAAGVTATASGLASAAPTAAEIATLVDAEVTNAQTALGGTQLAILSVVVLMLAFGLIYSLVRK